MATPEVHGILATRQSRNFAVFQQQLLSTDPPLRNLFNRAGPPPVMPSLTSYFVGFFIGKRDDSGKSGLYDCEYDIFP